MIRISALFSSILLFAGCAGFSMKDAPSQTLSTARLPDGLRTELISQIARAAEENNWRGVSISAASADGLLFEHAQGWASKAENRPMTPTTASMVGSVSKLFTVAAVMTLVEDGRIDLDAPITDYIPELATIQRTRIDLRTPKVRHLLYHHAGYQSDLLHQFILGNEPPDNWARLFAELPARTADYYQVQQPDTAMAYSNLTFSLLGVLVERTSGMSFDEYTQQALFAPMNMSSAGFVPTAEQINAMAYGLSGGDETPYVYIRDLPAGSMIASTRDLTHFGRTLLRQGRWQDRTILEAATIRTMLTRQNTRSPLDGDFRIGYGFWLDGTGVLPGSVRIAQHGGDLAPYHGFFLTLPDHDLTLSVLVNSPSSSMVLGALGEELARAILAARDMLPTDAPVTITGLAPADDANGVYAMPFGYVDLTYNAESNNYRIESSLVTLKGVDTGNNSWRLEYRLLGLFDLTPKAMQDMRVRFGRVNDAPIAWLYSGGINLGMLTPASPVDPTENWMDRTGTYKIVNDDQAMFKRLRLSWDDENGMLLAGPYIGFGLGMLIPATPLDRNRLQLQGYGRNLGEVMEWVDDDTIRFSGLEYRR